ncbi:phage tail sheath protein [Paenibacillus psychroresistens]|uniref:Phage tail sheath protein n=1 Tax=Paenibacillus psychroresistens TaxID=1778678 RepID=A0A6B8RL73_9BACL|nr:phage tail sheath protein [Paenibacillus psychroresistens]QGQ97060.1 phage tail sheath protein [Paenibacillus psychroresistens]
MPYLHGVYGQQSPTTDTLSPSGVSTLPVYIGTAPVQQLADPAAAINVPIIINSFADAVAKIGYSDDWVTFTLSEAVYAHFKNRIQPIGPIVVINVMDPETSVTVGTQSVAIANGVGYITAPAVLDTIAITGKVLGTDFKAEYTTDGRVKVSALPTKTLVNPSPATFDKMDIAEVTSSDVIGGNLAGVRTGISVVELVYVTHKQIPTILAAPGWSQVKLIKEALVTASQNINGHWDALVAADLDSGATSDTIAEAIAWKATNGYTDIGVKVGWPKAKSAGRIFWTSTLMVVRMQQTDFASDNVPYISPSNKQVDITGPVLASGADFVFDENQANELNQKGITTFNFRSGIWVLWGPHCANYEYGASIDPKDVFDAGIRMMMYMTNTFQDRFMSDVDGPLNRSMKDTILNDAGTWINSLIADGKLLYGVIEFLETSNPTSSIVEGNFLFNTQITTTPVAKSLTFVVQYTTKGITALFGGES